MNPIKRQWTAGVVIALSAGVGCNEARWREANTERQARIKKMATAYAAREAEGPERVRATIEMDRELATQRKACLQRTLDMVRQDWDRDITRWGDEAPHRAAALREIWDGHPETIPDTWARMVY